MTSTASLPNLESPDDDPRVWLEEIEGDRALSWVEMENARSMEALNQEVLSKDTQALKKALDNPGRIPQVTRRGGLLYNFWKDGQHARGIWRRTTLESYKTGKPDWDTLLDLDALRAKEDKDWAWNNASTLPPQHERAVIALSRGGGDAVTLREFDMVNRVFITDGFYLDEAKGRIDWLDQDTVLLNSAYGGPSFATDSGYSRTVRLWQRGTDPKDAPVLAECPKDFVSCAANIERTTGRKGSETIVFWKSKSFFDRTLAIGDRTGPKSPVNVPSDAYNSFLGDHLLVRCRTSWDLNGVNYGPDTCLVFRLSDFIAGKQTPEVVFEPNAKIAMQNARLVAGHVIIFLLENMRPMIRIIALGSSISKPSGISWTESTVLGLPELGDVSVSTLDDETDESDGSLLIQIQDSVTPPTVWLSSVSKPTLEKIWSRGPTFDATGLTVRRFDAVASDGTIIPYSVTGPKDLSSGDIPVYMTGYGGFAISSFPQYDSLKGLLWLARGGTCVLANIRGGGEFGTAWHQAGRHAGKRIAQDDFAAVAEDLVRRGITRRERIAADGASNGGLMIGNMWSRHADKFGALLMRIPLADMYRYSKLLSGASWISEYGDPMKPDEWAYLGKISAYHIAEAHKDRSLKILVTTTRRDDRVHPGHARKFAAKLREQGDEAWFYEAVGGGHGMGADNEQAAKFAAIGMLFLRQAIGWNS